MNRPIISTLVGRSRQRGAVTMFSAVLILILLTEMVLYAVQTGVFEQRKSSNELRHKIAFHMADGAIQQAKQFLKENSALVPSADPNLLPDGSGGWVGGWLAAGASQRWLACSDAGLTGTRGSHPCFGEPVTALRDGMYYYSVGGSTELPIDPGAFAADNTQDVTLNALLCMLHVDRDTDPIVQGCTTDPDLQDDRYYLVTLLARGFADCDTNRANCNAEALVAEKIGSFGPGGGNGGPNVPLTTRSTFPPTGTAEIVPNPNGGGLGVPMSSWMNANTNCPNQPVVDPSGGSWSTCERHEWYGQDTLPEDFKCPGNCACHNDRKRLSYSEQGEQQLGIDLVADENFPCDLFEHMFGIPKTRYEEVKASFTVIDDCSILDETSFGLYWFSGTTCTVNANTQIGSAKAPVFLVSAAESTRFNGGASLFGVLFVTDAENANATFNALGTMAIYGAAVIDGTLGQYNGTFQIVYVESVLETALDTGGFGAVAGGWTDFHATWQ